MLRYKKAPYFEKIETALSIPQLRQIFNRNLWIAQDEEVCEALIKKCRSFRSLSDSEYVSNLLADIEDEQDNPTYQDKFKYAEKRVFICTGPETITILLNSKSRNILRNLYSTISVMALDLCKDNRTKAAEMLGITPRTLRSWLNGSANGKVSTTIDRKAKEDSQGD